MVPCFVNLAGLVSVSPACGGWSDVVELPISVYSDEERLVPLYPERSMRHREPIHAYRLVFPDGDHGPELLWEWEQPYIDRLLWNAKTFGRQVTQRYFADWEALAAENQRIWEASYRWPAYEPWKGWQRWISEHRTLVATTQEVYEMGYPLKAGQ
ncbi:MAG TPA: hypothetical protein VLK82_13315 [Candidatus Tectomicrobia bacterium]|nr:hypothetical protein [Candidatus Tectomicrobia bacterium]